jgi:hypothetical protein
MPNRKKACNLYRTRRPATEDFLSSPERSRVPCAIYTDRRLSAVYDAANPRGPDDAF